MMLRAAAHCRALWAAHGTAVASTTTINSRQRVRVLNRWDMDMAAINCDLTAGVECQLFSRLGFIREG
jgi:hypothetical protein